MTTPRLETDQELIDVLRRQRSASVHQLEADLQITATAVRQRLQRLMADGLVERRLVREGRGRPAHHYVLTKAGEKASGTNYSDLVAVLWDELRAIEDPTIRTGLLRRVAKRLAGKTGAVEGASTEAKLESIADKMGDRDVPFEVAKQGELPVLLALACPYPELAEQDRSICSVEKMLFSEMLGERVRLTECRLEGAGCCSFVPTGASLPGND